MNTNKALDDFLAAAEKTSPAPWSLDHDDTAVASTSRSRGDWDWVVLPDEHGEESIGDLRGPHWRENNQFIVAARNSVEAVRELRERNKELEKALREIEGLSGLDNEIAGPGCSVIVADRMATIHQIAGSHADK